MILHADITGQGPPLALLHGLFGRARNLAAIARGLAGTHRVIALDLRNHGASPHAAGMKYPDLANDVLETLAAHDAVPAAMLGHSMGGKTAMASALLAPSQIDRLLVADIAPVAYTHHNAAIAAALRALDLRPGLTRQDASKLLQHAVPDPAIRGFLLQNLDFGAIPVWRIGLDHIAAGIADIESWPDLGAAPFDKPTLFVQGANSDYVRPSDRGIIRAQFPRAHVLTLKNAGHWLHADQPDAFLHAAAQFFQTPSASPD